MQFLFQLGWFAYLNINSMMALTIDANENGITISATHQGTIHVPMSAFINYTNEMENI